MKKIVWVFLGLIIMQGCNLSSSEESEFNYNWERVAQFSREQITAIHVSEDNDLYVATGNKLYKSFDINSTYLRVNSPDSANIVKIKIFQDRMLILANVFDESLGHFGENVSFVYQSLDDGITWQEIVSGFAMQDITYHNNRIHIGRINGIATIDLETDNIFFSPIVESKLNDEMEEIEVSPDGTIAVSCHEGVFISENNGDTWTEIGTDIHKDDDWIEAIEFNGSEIFALETSRVYRIDLITNAVETHKGFVGYEELELTNTGEIVKLGVSKLGVAYQNNLSFQNIYPTEISEDRLNLSFVDSFADGTLAITAGEKLFIAKRIN